MTPRIGIALGDVTGVGPEVVLKALARASAEDWARCLLIGDDEWAQRTSQQLGLNLPLERYEPSRRQPGIPVYNPLEAPLPPSLSVGALPAARAALEFLRAGARRCLTGELAALVTAPVNKATIIRSGHPSRGRRNSSPPWLEPKRPR
jgi:4-hydroxythreonine-4-phosphate dehydrogenase